MRAMPRTIQQLRNLGPRCAAWLAEIGIHDEDDLRSVGAAVAYRELVMRGIVRPHRMLLYALGGALLDVDCLKLPRQIKRALTEEASLD
jgi:DNA transformation protein